MKDKKNIILLAFAIILFCLALGFVVWVNMFSTPIETENNNESPVSTNNTNKENTVSDEEIINNMIGNTVVEDEESRDTRF